MLKGKQLTTLNLNGVSTHPVVVSHVVKKLAKKRIKKRMKKVIRASLAAKRKRNEAPQYAQNRSDFSALDAEIYPDYGCPAITLSDRDWDKLMDALDNPGEPSPELVKMWQKYA